MACPALLTKLIIVLGLTLFVCTLVQSLRTGYDYTDEQTIENDQLHKDLKCGFLFGWYTHMRVFKLLLEEPYNLELGEVVSSISSTGNLARSQIISLLGLKTVPVGVMWTVYLFTSIVNSSYERTRKPAEDYPKMIDTLGYVIGKLEANVVGCRPGNSFDNFDSVLKVLRVEGTDYYKTTVVEQFVLRGKAQQRNNDIISNEALRQMLESNLLVQSLFFNNLGMNDSLKREMQTYYNLRMDWNNTSEVLYKVWEKARYLDWTDTNLFSIKMYFNACYDFLEIIFFRLSLKHMAYLLDYPIKSAPFFRYVKEWHNIVVQFSTTLNLSNDLHIYFLLRTLRNLTIGKQTLIGVMDFLATTLNALCEPFGCDAGKNYVINNREFLVPCTSPIGVQIKSLKKTDSGVPIEYNSLENARTFLSHLALAFDTVNFSLIQSLTEYIEELNRPPSVVRLEESTQELQNLHINMKDYE